jgi:VanZ family protein
MEKVPSRLFLLLVALLIPVLSHQPSLKPPFELFPFQDKVFHFVEFGGLALALVLNKDLFRKLKRRTGMICFGILWAAADEAHQYFVPGRDCSFQDFLADGAGLVAGILLFSALFAAKEKRN